jgi:hypothetical protein
LVRAFSTYVFATSNFFSCGAMFLLHQKTPKKNLAAHLGISMPALRGPAAHLGISMPALRGPAAHLGISMPALRGPAAHSALEATDTEATAAAKAERVTAGPPSTSPGAVIRLPL